MSESRCRSIGLSRSWPFRCRLLGSPIYHESFGCVTPTPGIPFSSAPEHGRDYHAFGTENIVILGVLIQACGSGPGNSGRRGGGRRFPIPGAVGFLLPPRDTGSKSFSTRPECGSSRSMLLGTPWTPRGLPQWPLFPTPVPRQSVGFHDRSIPWRPVQVRTLVLGREHRPCGCSREDHDCRLGDHRSSRYDSSAATFRVPLEFVAKAAASDTNISSESRKIARPG